MRMSLRSLPVEIIEQIVDHSLPEGFESFALSCRDIYAICRPFVQRHNDLRSTWENFHYGKLMDWFGGSMHDAYRILEAIATEPKIGRYIRHADFTEDPCSRRARAPEGQFWENGADGPYRTDIYALLTSSRYFALAKLDPRTYYEHMFTDLIARRGRSGMYYSQYAFAALLQFLPNLRTVTLPDMWSPTEDTTALLSIIAKQARLSINSRHDSSLARLTEIHLAHAFGNPTLLKHVHPFTALPRLAKLRIVYVTASLLDSEIFLPSQSSFHSSIALVDLRLSTCCIDPVSMSNFLVGTPCLKTLKYSHYSFGDGLEPWNICDFVASIASRTAHSLEKLSLSIDQFNQPTLPGHATFNGFERLRSLTIPPEIVQCNMEYFCLTHQRPDNHLLPTQSEAYTSVLQLDTLMPSCLCRLKLYSTEWQEHIQSLETVLGQFAFPKRGDLPHFSTLKIQGARRGMDKEEFRRVCSKMFGGYTRTALVVLDERM